MTYEMHGMHKHPLYWTWVQMKQRCKNPKYGYWAGKGINVCARWDSFATFLEDVGERPDGYSLDRENNDGNYEPSNCRWATRAGQQRDYIVSEETQALIKRLRADGLSQQTIANMVGVHQTYVSQCLRNTKGAVHYLPLACNKM